MRTLDILVPQYKETDEIVKPLLDSIAIQQNVDFDRIGVIIVNDGTDVYLSNKLLSSYPFKVEYYKEKHRGVSGTRNACLDHSTAQYVMFCDADDMFYNACGLWIIFNEIANGFDVYASKFIEEIRTIDKQQPFYVNRENDSTFVHGKVQRRDFLINNNIRWNESLTIHEDSYFNCLCQTLAMRTPGGFKYGTDAFYLWKWRKESVCRRDPLYLHKTYTNMLESNTALVQALLNRRLIPDAARIAFQMTYDVYYTLNLKEWLDEPSKEYVLKTEQRFKQYWTDFKNLIQTIEAPQQAQIISAVRARYTAKGLINEKFTFEDWILHIETM